MMAIISKYLILFLEQKRPSFFLNRVKLQNEGIFLHIKIGPYQILLLM